MLVGQSLLCTTMACLYLYSHFRFCLWFPSCGNRFNFETVPRAPVDNASSRSSPVAEDLTESRFLFTKVELIPLLVMSEEVQIISSYLSATAAAAPAVPHARIA